MASGRVPKTTATRSGEDFLPDKTAGGSLIGLLFPHKIGSVYCTNLFEFTIFLHIGQTNRGGAVKANSVVAPFSCRRHGDEEDSNFVREAESIPITTQGNPGQAAFRRI